MDSRCHVDADPRCWRLWVIRFGTPFLDGCRGGGVLIFYPTTSAPENRGIVVQEGSGGYVQLKKLALNGTHPLRDCPLVIMG